LNLEKVRLKSGQRADEGSDMKKMSHAFYSIFTFVSHGKKIVLLTISK